MHLGLIDGPFVPHNLISTQESPVPLLQFQMAPRLKILMASGSKKGTQIYFSFFLKSPGKRTPSRFPNRAPMERDTCLQGILHISQKPHKNSSNKKAPRKKPPSMFPQSGAPTKADTNFRALLNISLGSPVKEPSLKVSFIESVAEKSPTTRALQFCITALFRVVTSLRTDHLPKEEGSIFCQTFVSTYHQTGQCHNREDQNKDHNHENNKF
jgi:hypothetical protein